MLNTYANLQADVIEGLVSLNNPGFVWKSWHSTLLVIAVIAFSAIFNTILASRLPSIEAVLLILHIAGLFAIVIPLWVMSPRADPHDVIFGFANEGGWSKGISAMIGLPFMFGILYVSTSTRNAPVIHEVFG